MERHDDNALIVYTDGSCKNSPRRGGFAFSLVIAAGEVDEIHDYNPPGVLGATNNEMELRGAIEALRLIGSPHCPVARARYEKVVLYTDSMYVLDGVPRAETYWPQNVWMTRENEPVLSPEKRKELIRLKKRVGRVEFRRVAGHKTNPHNKRVDKLAKESADLADRSRLPGRLVGRKLSKRSTEARSVPMRGQVEAIRIVVVRHVSARNQAYKYEVVGEKSPDLGAVDDVFAKQDIWMRRGHVYEVRFADAGRGRWIDEVIREIEID